MASRAFVTVSPDSPKTESTTASIPLVIALSLSVSVSTVIAFINSLYASNLVSYSVGVPDTYRVHKDNTCVPPCDSGTSHCVFLTNFRKIFRAVSLFGIGVSFLTIPTPRNELGARTSSLFSSFKGGGGSDIRRRGGGGVVVVADAVVRGAFSSEEDVVSTVVFVSIPVGVAVPTLGEETISLDSIENADDRTWRDSSSFDDILLLILLLLSAIVESVLFVPVAVAVAVADTTADFSSTLTPCSEIEDTVLLLVVMVVVVVVVGIFSVF
mmetsp:Transcript_3448/g.4076  ORF Transcript_3448/g.4076 Transcript_3448/m.4076 type:complete len:269 (+) Transcript_3448:1780-2586(+)